MTMIEALYTAGLRGLRPLLPLFAHGEGKLARGIRGRRGAVDRLARWGVDERDPARSLVWFHAPSVGEGLQAGAIMRALRQFDPSIAMVYTYFSPSAEPLASRLGADVTDYLPLDLPDDMARVLDALRPAAIVFTRTEVWPNLTAEATRRGIPVLLASATLPRGSSRLRLPARALLTPTHARLAAVGAISAEDGERFALLGVPPDRIQVTGDSRFDQVAARAEALDPENPLLRSLRDEGGLTIVAGSTWAKDEEPLLAAFAALPRAGERRRLILAPHEPTDGHLVELEQRLSRAGLGSVRLGQLDAAPEPAPVILVDRVGVLGDLYSLADIAYVGGGFGTAGLHSVLEPAAFSVPVIFGPNHGNSREAGELIAKEGGFAVADQIQLGRVLARLVTDRAARLAAGAAAGQYVTSGTGAAERGAKLILSTMR